MEFMRESETSDAIHEGHQPIKQPTSKREAFSTLPTNLSSLVGPIKHSTNQHHPLKIHQASLTTSLGDLSGEVSQNSGENKELEEEFDDPISSFSTTNQCRDKGDPMSQNPNMMTSSFMKEKDEYDVDVEKSLERVMEREKMIISSSNLSQSMINQFHSTISNHLSSSSSNNNNISSTSSSLTPTLDKLDEMYCEIEEEEDKNN